MRTSKFIFFMATALYLSRPVAAQSINLIPCWRPMIGIGVGLMVNGDRNGGESEYAIRGSGAAPNIQASIEVPVTGEWAARVEAGTVSWAFEDHDFRGNLLLRDQVRLKQFTVGAMKSLGGPCGIPLRLFAGGGAGVYRYEYGQGGAVTRGGAHVFAGMDILLGDRAAIALGVAVHVVGGPDRTPVFSYTFFPGQFSVGMKFGF